MVPACSYYVRFQTWWHPTWDIFIALEQAPGHDSIVYKNLNANLNICLSDNTCESRQDLLCHHDILHAGGRPAICDNHLYSCIDTCMFAPCENKVQACFAHVMILLHDSCITSSESVAARPFLWYVICPPVDLCVFMISPPGKRF